MKQIALTVVLSVLVTLAVVKIFFWHPYRNIYSLDRNDSAAICKAFVKKCVKKHKRPHDPKFNLSEAFAEAEKDYNKHNMHDGSHSLPPDHYRPGLEGGDAYSITITPKTGTSTGFPLNAPKTFNFSFTNQRSSFTRETGQGPIQVTYTSIIGQDYISSLLNNYSTNPFEDGDADYFMIDAASMLNLIAFNNDGDGNVNQIQDLVFELGRDVNNSNRLTLIVGGLNKNGVLTQVHGVSPVNALENSYPCPECLVGQ